ncbi:ACP phosphodiesterase [Okeania sp. SIO2C9]|uniref:ACP phosphodiesterase n=1 Tax=Okeania sp. SIO2C9 TaxID=2607791 RepID=UPI002600F50E|nr:ACP phosphodiesterase [Okeania sp. SIO2C9]
MIELSTYELSSSFIFSEKYSRITGNLLGDFVKGYLEQYETIYSHEIIQGIKTHRQVDCFTDTHTIYLRSKNRISNNHRLLAGIIIDICYDHFLANHWNLFAYENLDVFVQKIYIIWVHLNA